MHTDRSYKWVNNTAVPIKEQIETLDKAAKMIHEAIDLLESIAVVGNEFNFGTINQLRAILDRNGSFNFYPSLRNWRLGLEGQQDNERIDRHEMIDNGYEPDPFEDIELPPDYDAHIRALEKATDERLAHAEEDRAERNPDTGHLWGENHDGTVNLDTAHNNSQADESQMSNDEKLSRIHDNLIQQGFGEAEITERLNKFRVWVTKTLVDFNSPFNYFGIESMTGYFADDLNKIINTDFDAAQSDSGL